MNQITSELAAENPEAAAALQRMAEQREIRAAAAAMRHAKHTGGVAGVQQLADRARQDATGAYEARLAEIALRPALLADEKEREEFIWAHATVLQALQAEDAGPLAADYFEQLEQATRTPAQWRVAKNNATIFFLFKKDMDSPFFPERILILSSFH